MSSITNRERHSSRLNELTQRLRREVRNEAAEEGHQKQTCAAAAAALQNAGGFDRGDPWIVDVRRDGRH